jgi:hypothetical protein
MLYDVSKWSWGLELEIGDIPRNLEIPNHLGEWENFEICVVNQLSPYKGMACDPKGLNPPVGGEINTRPTTTIDKQIKLVRELLYYFKSKNLTPTTSAVSHTHVHVHVPNLKDKLIDLKKLLCYLWVNQETVIDNVYDIKLNPSMSDYAINYISLDGGRKYDAKKIHDALSLTETPVFYKSLVLDPTNPSDRHYINIKNIFRNDTIEFRCFRNTIDPEQIRSMLEFCKDFLNQGLNTDISKFKFEKKYNFPKLDYDDDLFKSWEKTKHPVDFSVKKPNAFKDPL